MSAASERLGTPLPHPASATPRPLRLFALVDCSAFYCSCERVFDPSLVGVPVAVLSNNDDCIIARSQEVKDLGIPMGAPFFKHKSELAARGVHVLSSNYCLYGDMCAGYWQFWRRARPTWRRTPSTRRF